MTKKEEKIFVIINSYLVGDMLLVNPLIQNIKRLFKDSKIVMLSSSNLSEIAKNQEGVDEVIIWDRKNKHKGLFGMFKFVKEFPYKKVFATFPIYATDRPIMLSLLLNSKYILFRNKQNILKYFFKSKYPIDKIYTTDIPMQYWHVNLLKGITKEELIDCPMIFNIDKTIENPVNEKEYIVLCPISSRLPKDMPKETVIDIIKSANKKVVLLGNGEISRKLSNELKNENLDNLIDLTDKTTLSQAACIIKNSIGTISVDTGLMHLACAVNNPVACVFYENKKSAFIPRENMYKAKLINENQNAQNILNTFYELIKKETLNG
ncbi:glycosyltransferase family 9 protein [bacterium]|nr:glycosyltransferase family 9 protein [bacterium]